MNINLNSLPAKYGHVAFGAVLLMYVLVAIFTKPGVEYPKDNSLWSVPKQFCSDASNAMCKP